jgi:hypothetical protein
VTWVLLLGPLNPEQGVMAQDANYEEARVPPYQLPPVLVDAAGQPIADVPHWERRRAELLERFAAEMFGRRPSTTATVEYDIQPLADGHLAGARARQITLTFRAQDRRQRWRLLLLLPQSPEPVPVFLGLNFEGNHTVCDHPDVALPEGWVGQHPHPGGAENRPSEAMRGRRASRWPWPAVIAQGFGIATLYYGDIDADTDDQFRGGAHDLLRDPKSPLDPSTPPPDWGSISAWAWGLSRVMDYLETDPSVDAGRVIVLGHSRLGKTALWAGATDPRFAMIVSNNSGCGGAALSRRRFGETVARINRVFPHWFNDRFQAYNDREDELPFDQHQLIACLAPRPVYIASASEDLWADPRGEFLAALHASPVYRLYGRDGLGLTDFPPPDQPCFTTVGYHLRSGPHDITAYDWQQFIHHAQLHLPANPGR